MTDPTNELRKPPIDDAYLRHEAELMVNAIWAKVDESYADKNGNGEAERVGIEARQIAYNLLVEMFSDARAALSRLSARGDEYHTMDDLYAHRFALTAALVKRLPPEASCKSRKNGDGSTWDGLFVVYIDTPQGQVSYHYKTELWDKMPCREVETPPPYDGHTPESTLDRLMSIEGLSAQAEPAKDARALVSKIVVALSDWQLDVIELGTIDKAEDRLAPMIERSFQARLASVKEQYRQAMQASQAEVDELVARLSASGLGDTCIDCEHDGEQDKWRPCSSCARNSHDNYESRKS